MTKPLRGVSFIDVIVGSALVLIIFLALFTLLRANLLVSTLGKAKAGATAIANAQLEYIRTLPYDSIGTVGGIPAGSIPQTATTTENGIEYVTRTFVQYVDDPADGTGGSDSNGIITDYKRIKVSVTYVAGNVSRSVELVSNQSPVGIESTVGGGTLRIEVVGATGSPVSGAQVDIENPSVSPSVDLTAFTDASGVVFLPGAATSTDYRVFVTKNGYSSTQTYPRDETNQNPTPGYLTVVGSQTTTGTFAIDVLASFTLQSFSPIQPGTVVDTFTDASGLSSQSNTAVSGSALSLATGEGGYVASGSALSTAVAPDYLASWENASSTLSMPAGTSARTQVVDASGTLLSDEILPGNSTGFTGEIDLSGISTATYPSLGLRAVLTSSDPLVTPSVLDWGIGYTVGPIPLPDVSFTLEGAKTIGSTGAGEPLYKTTASGSTGEDAITTLQLEWDVYQLAINDYDIVDACAPAPYTLAPGSTTTTSLYLVPATTHSLLVSVRDSVGAIVPDAVVTISGPGVSDNAQSSACGTAYFGNLTAGSYTITISKSGYTPQTYTNVSVSGQTLYATAFE